MFRETVAQNPTVAFRAGTRNLRKSSKLLNREGDESIGPKPPAVRYAHPNSRRPTASRIGALMPCRKRMYSIPLRTTARLMSQKVRKQIAVLYGRRPQPGASVEINVLIASPPIHVWMPNHPQATNALSTAATFAPRTPNEARASTGNGTP